MTQKKSQFISAFDVCARVFKALANAVADAGGSDEDLRRIETNSELRKKIGALVMEGRKVVVSTFTVVVDYSRSLSEMISIGNYDWKNDDINEKHFPSPELPAGTKSELNLELHHFNRRISSDGAISELRMRPATFQELLAFGAQYSEEQRKYPIVALGSLWRDGYGSRGVAVLWCDGVGRYLNLGYFEGDWDPYYRFLAVRES